MPSNLASIEEVLKLNNELILNEIVSLEERILGKVCSLEVSFQDGESTNFFTEKERGSRYIVTVSQEIMRLLTTPIGSRVMRPEYGSELYKVRDREMNNYWRLMAIKYTFIAINRHIERVRCRKVLFELQGDGKMKMKLELEKR